MKEKIGQQEESSTAINKEMALEKMELQRNSKKGMLHHRQSEQKKIILIRHGKPILQPQPPLSSADFGKWLSKYNEASIDENVSPNTTTRQIVESSEIIISSNLKRSIESAKILGITKKHIVDKTFEEVGMPYNSWVFPKMPPTLWIILNRTLWFLGYSKNCESYQDAKSRSIECAQKLQEIVKENHSIALIGHGFMNRFIGKQLLNAGWLGSKRPQSGYWKASIYLK